MIKCKSIMENREFLSLDENSLNMDSETRKIFLDKVKEYTKELLKDKQEFVNRYDKEDVEDILKGKAVKDAIIYIKNMKRKDIKELVIKSLMKEESNALKFTRDPFVKKVARFLNMPEEYIGNKENMKLLKREEVPSFIQYQSGVYKLNSPKGKIVYLHHAPMTDNIWMYDKDGKRISDLKENEIINSKKYIAERESNPEDTINMDIPLFIRMLEYAREDASTDIDLHDVAKKAIGLSSEGEVLTMDNYEDIIGDIESLGEDLDLGHEDNEPHMIKGELYRIGKYAIELYKMVDGFEGKGEVDFPAWWQSKVTTSMNNMVSAKHYLDFELKEPAIDAVVNITSDEEVVDEKKLTPAEKKKKEEIVKSMKKDFKGPKPAMYAIATDKAKDLAEIVAKRLKNKI